MCEGAPPREAAAPSLSVGSDIMLLLFILSRRSFIQIRGFTKLVPASFQNIYLFAGTFLPYLLNPASYLPTYITEYPLLYLSVFEFVRGQARIDVIAVIKDRRQLSLEGCAMRCGFVHV